MKHFDPRSTALPAELVPLCNLYDRHILRQKVIIQLSLPASDRAKLRGSGGDAALERVDQIRLWHLYHLFQSNDERRAQSGFLEAIDLSKELSMELNLGLPDYRAMWIAGAEFKDMSPVRCSLAQPCGFPHMCLRCRAGDTKVRAMGNYRQ